MHSESAGVIAAQYRRLTAASLALITAAAVGGCSGTRTSATATSNAPATGTAGTSAPRSPSAPSISTSKPSPDGPLRVVVARLRWRLPYPVSRAVATTADGMILLAGGLNRQGTSRAAAVWIRLSNGRVIRSARLPVATHDSAGWAAHGGLVVAGGGTGTSVATVQQVRSNGAARVVASLPRPRSDAVAASVGSAAYVVGGYDGAVLDPLVLASSDGGRTFHPAARLPVPVRYAAVTTTGHTLWVVGGQTSDGLTNAVQRVDTATGKARIVGRLPASLEAATARVIGGKLIVFGGATDAGTTSAILTCAIPAIRCRRTGRLPYAVQNAAGATVGGHTYLLGGERDGVVLDSALRIDYARTGAA